MKLFSSQRDRMDDSLLSHSNNEMICIRNLTFGYKNAQPLFKNISLNIRPASRIAIIGRNGVGKTTLIETLLGLNIPSRGKVFFPKSLLNATGFIFQDIDFDNAVKLGEIFSFFTRLARKRVNPPSREEVEEIFAKYELETKIKRRFSSLSGGQKQKFKLLVCLELKPRVLILDELTTALDFEWREKIIELIGNYLIQNPKTILILVSHSKDEIESLTNEHYLLQNRVLTRIGDLNKYFGQSLRKWQ